MKQLKIKSKIEVEFKNGIFCEVLKNATEFNFYKKDGKNRDYVYDYEPSLDEWIEVLNACWDEKLHILHEIYDFADCHNNLNCVFGKFLPSKLRMVGLSSFNFEREANLCGLINEYIHENGHTEEVKNFRDKHKTDEKIVEGMVQWNSIWLKEN